MATTLTSTDLPSGSFHPGTLRAAPIIWRSFDIGVSLASYVVAVTFSCSFQPLGCRVAHDRKKYRIECFRSGARSSGSYPRCTLLKLAFDLLTRIGIWEHRAPVCLERAPSGRTVYPPRMGAAVTWAQERVQSRNSTLLNGPELSLIWSNICPVRMSYDLEKQRYAANPPTARAPFQ